MAARKFLVPIDLSKLELQNPAMHNLASAPSSPVKGQFFINTTDNIAYYWNGTAWTPMSGGGGVTYGTITAETTFGASKSDGVATTVARSDHAHGNPTHVNADHAAINLSALAVPTATVNMNGQLVSSVATPVSSTDAANKAYVDNLTSGLSWKEAVRAATTANITLSGAQSIDGVSVVANDRVLVKNQSTASANGIYVAAAGAWSRATDADAAGEIEGLAVFVMEGTTQGDTAWVCTTDAPITVGSTNLAFAQFSGPGAITAGAGMTSTGTTLNVIAGTGMVVNADDVAVLRTDTNGRVPLRYAVDVGTGALTSITVTHNLNTLDVCVDVFEKSSGAEVDCDIVHASVNTITLIFAVAPASNAYRCVVIG